jgi:hypothetical protein
LKHHAVLVYENVLLAEEWHVAFRSPSKLLNFQNQKKMSNKTQLDGAMLMGGYRPPPPPFKFMRE